MFPLLRSVCIPFHRPLATGNGDACFSWIVSAYYLLINREEGKGHTFLVMFIKSFLLPGSRLLDIKIADKKRNYCSDILCRQMEFVFSLRLQWQFLYRHALGLF